MTSTSFRSGYVAIVGWPNVGKSTLINALVGSKVSIISPKPQTTRESILGIINQENLQIIFVDTPGWLDPRDPFQGFMKRSIVRALFDDADVIVWVTDPQALTSEHLQFGSNLSRSGKPYCVAINKIDVGSAKAALLALSEAVKRGVGADTSVFPISARTKEGLSNLLTFLKTKLPISPPYYPTDQVTDRWERFYAAEFIREAMLNLFSQEIPHASLVTIEEFKEQAGKKDLIRAVVTVETEGQKRIVIGEKGRMIKAVGQKARQAIEQMTGRPTFLELLVKVRKNWRKDPVFLKEQIYI